MKILDRYLLRLFIKVLVICFLSLTGLYIVIDAFNNLDEFLEHGRENHGVAPVLVQYYVPRALTFLDRTGALVALMAAVFAITWLQRNNEMTALMAAGIPRTRVVKPLAVAVLAFSLLLAFNREWTIPLFRSQLLDNAQNLSGGNQRQLHPRYDNQTNIYLGGTHVVAAERKIIEPSFRLPPEMFSFSKMITGAAARYLPPSAAENGSGAGGYLFENVHPPAEFLNQPSLRFEGKPLVITPVDASWLSADQCFVVSNLDYEYLCNGSAWRQYSSTAELLAGLRNPCFDFGADVKVIVHARLLQPLLDVTLFFLGLPLVMGRQHHNIFVAAGGCLLLVASFFLVVLTCHALGSNYLIDPALAAWAPLLIFAPLAYCFVKPLWE